MSVRLSVARGTEELEIRLVPRAERQNGQLIVASGRLRKSMPNR